MIRRVLLALLALGGLTLAIVERRELREIAATLARANPSWILAAAILQLGFFLANAMLYRESFRSVAVTVRFRDLIAPLFGSLVANALVPSGGAAGAAMIVDGASRRGESKARAVAGTLLAMIVDLVALALIAIIVLVPMKRGRPVETWQTLSALGLVAIIAAMTALLMLAMFRPRWLRGTLEAVRATIDGVALRWRRTPWLGERWSERVAADLTEAGQALRRAPGSTAGLLAIGLAMHGLRWASMAALFPAFRQPFDPSAALAGYTLGMLVWIVAPLPQGVGVVEAAIGLVLVPLGIPFRVAAAIALSFRGLAFWIPLAIGFLLLGRLNRSRSK